MDKIKTNLDPLNETITRLKHGIDLKITFKILRNRELS